ANGSSRGCALFSPSGWKRQMSVEWSSVSTARLLTSFASQNPVRLLHLKSVRFRLTPLFAVYCRKWLSLASSALEHNETPPSLLSSEMNGCKHVLLGRPKQSPAEIG
ncbi:hypothetical protein PFISCL1PPCAC_21404, partial [Pristionchus fissidentatus]